MYIVFYSNVKGITKCENGKLKDIWIALHPLKMEEIQPNNILLTPLQKMWRCYNQMEKNLIPSCKNMPALLSLWIRRRMPQFSSWCYWCISAKNFSLNYFIMIVIRLCGIQSGEWFENEIVAGHFRAISNYECNNTPWIVWYDIQ